MSTRRSVTKNLAAHAAIAARPIPSALASNEPLVATHGGRAMWQPKLQKHPLVGLVRERIDGILANGRVDLAHANSRYIPMYFVARAPVFMVGTGDIVDPVTGHTEVDAGLSISIFDGLKLRCDGAYRTRHAAGGFVLRWPHADEIFLKQHADRVRIDHDRIVASLYVLKHSRNPTT